MPSRIAVSSAAIVTHPLHHNATFIDSVGESTQTTPFVDPFLHPAHCPNPTLHVHIITCVEHRVQRDESGVEETVRPLQVIGVQRLQ